MTELARMHAELARVVVAQRELSDVLHEITIISRRALPGTDAASITLIEGERAFTAVYDGRLALDADELQYERGYGPCIEAGRAEQTLHIDDMWTEQRWPDYTCHAARQGIGSSLSVPLALHKPMIGALNGYATRSHAFDEDDIDLAEEVATWVALAVSNAEASFMSPAELRRTCAAMMSRASLEHAHAAAVDGAHPYPATPRVPR